MCLPATASLTKTFSKNSNLRETYFGANVEAEQEKSSRKHPLPNEDDASFWITKSKLFRFGRE